MKMTPMVMNVSPTVIEMPFAVNSTSSNEHYFQDSNGDDNYSSAKDINNNSDRTQPTVSATSLLVVLKTFSSAADLFAMLNVLYCVCCSPHRIMDPGYVHYINALFIMPGMF